jgi:predicted nucleotidyltransferase
LPGEEVALNRPLEAIRLLREKFGAKEVILFGSLARRGGFTLFSDIDLAVRGIAPDRFFEAVGLVTGLSAEFKIDLVEIETSSPDLYRGLQKAGKPL